MIPDNNICFIANFSKTYFFHEIAKNLADQSGKICWITTNIPLYQFLIEHYPAEQVLLLNRDYIAKEKMPTGDFKINELIYGDRVLRHEKENGIRWLTNIQQPLYDFFKEHAINYAFGELTWAHEVLIHRMLCWHQELKGRFLNPHVIRIPNGRFAFFEDERQSKIVEIDRPAQSYGKVLEVRKPDYLKINDKRLKQANSILGRLDRIKRFITNENIDKKDPTLINNTGVRLKTRSQEEFFKETYKSVRREDFEAFKEYPYIFIGLHKQPEASVDVFGRYYEDQFQNIQNIWRVLPSGWKLLIKEHTNAIGDRHSGFYRRLAALPNVHFIKERTDAYAVIQEAELVVTITGTIAYEAALMRIPSLTFAPTFFNRLNGCRQLTLETLDRMKSLRQLINNLKEEPDNRLAFTNYLLNNSFEGTFSDPISNEAILKPENIAKVSQAFEQVMQMETQLIA